MEPENNEKTEQIEMKLLLEAMRLRYGYDFSGYTPDTLKRRLGRNACRRRSPKISDMIPKLLYDPSFFDTLVYDLSITVTEMFRDPAFYLAMRRQVMPLLQRLPHPTIWHAGCATGEEVYSMAILLKEQGLYDRTRIYATDINEAALRKAREGIYPASAIQLYTENYQKAGGIESFGDYYHADYGVAKMKYSLKENITFANHNLVTDAPFTEVNLILCRNVFIYFGKDLQNKTLEMFRDSLSDDGLLALGSAESLMFSSIADDFDDLASNEKIYRRKANKCARI